MLPELEKNFRHKFYEERKREVVKDLLTEEILCKVNFLISVSLPLNV